MKNLKFMLIGAAALLTFACSPDDDYNHPSEANRPEMSDYNINIAIDTANNVTFSIDDPTSVPVWTFTSVTGQKTIIAQNDYVKNYPQKGDYSVEVKVYNVDGMTVGSVVQDFTVEKNYVAPFARPYIAMLSGGTQKTWVWDAASQGHIGCGPSGTNGLAWWSCGPYGKDGVGMYDDRLTFSSDCSYTYDPGVGGTVYVNAGSGFKPEYSTGNGDYEAPVDPIYTYCTFEKVKQNDVEQLYLTFPTQTIVGYIPNPEAYTTPRFKVLNITDNVLEMVIDNGGIAWHYQFIPLQN